MPTNKTGQITAQIAVGLIMLTSSAWSASLTIAFIGLVLPTHPIAPWLAVIVFTGGALAWAYAYVSIDGAIRRAIAITMTAINFIVDLAVTIGQLWIGGQQIADVPADLGTIVLSILSVGVAANILASLAYLISSPSARRSQALAEARDRIATAEIEHIHTQAATLAGQQGELLAHRHMTILAQELDLEPPPASNKTHPKELDGG